MSLDNDTAAKYMAMIGRADLFYKITEVKVQQANEIVNTGNAQ